MEKDGAARRSVPAGNGLGDDERGRDDLFRSAVEGTAGTASSSSQTGPGNFIHPLALRPRERIVSAAQGLFRKHGLRGIGVDAIAAAAGTNKMTLYRHFGSKDDLVAACLRDVGSQVDAMWKQVEAAYPDDPLAQLHAWLRLGGECVGGDGRGCDMANAAVELAACEHPARHVIEEFKAAQRYRLTGLCHAAGVADPGLLADALLLLLEGARVTRQSMGAEGPAARFREIGEAVIASFARAATLASTPKEPARTTPPFKAGPAKSVRRARDRA